MQQSKLIFSEPVPWQLQKINATGGNISTKMNQIQLSWPKISMKIWPNQTVRINTGWTSAQMPPQTLLTTFPHKSLISNNLIAGSQVLDQTNTNQELIQIIMNNNEFPVEIQYKSVNGQDSYSLHRIHPQTLLSEQILQFDFGNFLTGVLGVAAHVLPFVL